MLVSPEMREHKSPQHSANHMYSSHIVGRLRPVNALNRRREIAAATQPKIPRNFDTINPRRFAYIDPPKRRNAH
jgi:hypothetical protein